MKLRLASALPYAGALAGIAPIFAPLDVRGLWTEAETVLASSTPVPEVGGCPDFLGCGAPDPMAPCPECTTLSMPEQYRCSDDNFFNCTIDSGGPEFRDKRLRWKWKCPNEVTYISCGQWDPIGCCSADDGYHSCAGNSGLVVCEGVPPGQ